MIVSLVWWEVLGIAWIALGVIIVCAFELMSRLSHQESFLLRGSLLSSLGTSAAFIFGAPFVLLYVTRISAKILWEGRVPVTKRIWWPARAAQFERTTPGMRSSREHTLVRMVEIRRRKDPRLRHAKRPDDWPMFQLWATPEATILNTIEDFGWLKDGGLSDQSAFQHLDARRVSIAHSPSRTDSTLLEYVARTLGTVDPQYLSLPSQILDQQIEMAEKWTRDEIQWKKSGEVFPPVKWLTRQISLKDIDRVEMGKSEDWNRIKTRHIDGDELWEFSSPTEYWEGLAGRQGIALIRGDRPIAHVITVMS